MPIFMHLFDLIFFFFLFKLGIKAQMPAERDTARPHYSGTLFIALQSA